jgi:hypothetical protein
MDSTLAILGILVVAVALVAYIFIPEVLRKRRLHKELCRRDRERGGTE